MVISQSHNSTHLIYIYAPYIFLIYFNIYIYTKLYAVGVEDMLDETKLMDPYGSRAFPQSESDRAPHVEPPEVVSDGILFGPDGMPMGRSGA